MPNGTDREILDAVERLDGRSDIQEALDDIVMEHACKLASEISDKGMLAQLQWLREAYLFIRRRSLVYWFCILTRIGG